MQDVLELKIGNHQLEDVDHHFCPILIRFRTTYSLYVTRDVQTAIGEPTYDNLLFLYSYDEVCKSANITVSCICLR